MPSLTSSQLLLFGLVLAAGLLVALFPIFPRQVTVQQGDIASRTVRSPHDVTFVSSVLTEQAREDAAAAVPEVTELDSNVRSTQLATLIFASASVTEVREDAALDDAEKRARLLGILALGDLSRGSIDAVLALSDGRWERVRQEADRVLDEAMSGAIGPNGVEAAQDGLFQRIGPDLAADEANLVADLVRPLVVPTIVVNEEETKRARDEARLNVAPVQQSIAANQIIVAEDQAIEATALEVLGEVGLLRSRVEWDSAVSVVIVALLAALVLTLYLWLFPVMEIASSRSLVLLALLIAGPVLVAKVYFSLVLPDDEGRFLAYFLPLAAAPMLVATLLSGRLALVIGLVQAVLMTFAVVYLPELLLAGAVQPLDIGRVLLVYGMGAAIGVFAVHRTERLNQYVAGGVLVGVAALAMLFAFWLLEPERDALDVAWMTTAAAVNGLGSGLLTAGGFAAVGALLGVTTRVQLMELSQLNAPLLRRLQDEAPGTFHHSIIVGNLAERAADLVGADALLVRVGCYYHDIGKVLQPGYYIENQQGGDNPHDELDPQGSARIISQHVRGGMELAERHGLPARVRAFIPQHHGTRLVSYFYRVASQADAEVDPDQFRYPGPKPQTRETAIVMLADSTEAMVRANADRSPERIDAVVEEVMAERLAEGELEECDLTLRDLRIIAESFKQTLRGVYHPRIAYPEPTAEERRALMGRFQRRRRPPALAEAPPPSQEQRPTW